MDLIMSLSLVAIAAWAAAGEAIRWRGRRALWRRSGITATDRCLPAFLCVAQLVSRRVPLRWWSFLSEKRRKGIESLLAAAGVDGEFDAQAFVVTQGIGALAGMALAAAALPVPPFAGAAIGAALGWFAFPIGLRGRAGRRRRAMERALPGMLDWLAMSVEAGEGFSQALGRIAGKLAPGPLRDEMARLNAEMRTGVPRRVALSALARRADVPSVSSLAALLIQADVLGTGIGHVLRSVSQRLRAERFARAERQGVVAAQKALLPLVLCIMPATFIVVFGPLVVRLVVWGPRALMGLE